MTALSDTAARLDALEAFFATGRTRDLEFRRAALLRLQRAIRRHEADIAEALRTDLHKSADEGWLCETGMVLAEIRDQLRHLDRRARPQRTGAPLFLFPSSGRILHEPKGVVLIRAISELSAAAHPLAAGGGRGGRQLHGPETLRHFGRHPPRAGDDHRRKFRPGTRRPLCRRPRPDRRTARPPLRPSLLHGRRLLRADRHDPAAEHLTPVTLELGGKSPCIVDRTADPDLAARRIVWGKLLNAGQTCIAPDYLFVHRDLRNALLERIPAAIERFYGSDLRHSPAYPRIVSDKAFTRLCGYLDAVRDRILLAAPATPPTASSPPPSSTPPTRSHR